MTNDVPKGKFGIFGVFWQRKADKMAGGRKKKKKSQKIQGKMHFFLKKFGQFKKKQ